jgi:hypothetical protein
VSRSARAQRVLIHISKLAAPLDEVNELFRRLNRRSAMTINPIGIHEHISAKFIKWPQRPSAQWTDGKIFRACLKMWRQASLPAVEGGILPPGKNVHLSKRSHFTITFRVTTRFRRAGSPGSTSARMADATIFRQALKKLAGDDINIT